MPSLIVEKRREFEAHHGAANNGDAFLEHRTLRQMQH